MAGKRSNGEGCIRKTKSGSWRGEIMDGYTPEGKRHIVRFTAKTRAGVLDKIRAYRAHMDSCICISLRLRSPKRSRRSTPRRIPEPPERKPYG